MLQALLLAPGVSFPNPSQTTAAESASFLASIFSQAPAVGDRLAVLITSVIIAGALLTYSFYSQRPRKKAL